MTASWHRLRLGRVVVPAAVPTIFVLLFVYPVGRLLLMPWLPSLGPSGAAMAGGVSHLPWVAIGNTLRLGLMSTLLAVPLGVTLGWLLERRQWSGRLLLTVALWLIFLTPSYLLTTGWQIVFSLPALHRGVLAGLFFGQPGIVALLALKGLPFATLAARASWRAIGSEILDAARMLVLSAWRRGWVLARLLLPAAGSAFAVVFIESIQEFGIPATLGAQIHLPIITYAIYERLATTPVDFVNAAWLSWSLVILAFLAAAVHLYLSGRYSSALVHGRQRTTAATPCKPLERLGGQALTAVVAIVGVGIPGAAIVHAAWQPGGDTSALSVAWDSLVHSTLYAGTGALLATLLAMLMIRRQRSRATLVTEAVSLANMAIPGLVLGAAYVIAFNSAWLPLYGTAVLLVVAYVAAQVPMLMRFLQAPMQQIHHSLTDAARLHGLPWAVRTTDIQAPLLLTPFLWGWTMAFGQIFFELPISELLYPAGHAPVGVVIVSLNQSLRFTEASRLALAGIALSLLVAGGMALLLRLLVLPATPKEALS